MKLKRYRWYKMDFNGSLCSAFCVLCGLSLFLRIAYYFMFTNPADCGTGELIFSMALPLLLMVLILVVLKFLKLNAPGLMGILGCCACLLLMIGSFITGGTLRIVLSAFAYLAASVLLLGTTGGYVPTRLFCVAWFCLIFLVRLLFFLPRGKILAQLLAISDLSIIAAMTILPLTMQPVKPKK